MNGHQPIRLAVDEAGQALTFAAGRRASVRLSVRTSDPSCRIVVIDDRFVALGNGTGRLTLDLEPGLYKVRVQRGASSLGFVDRFVALDRDVDIAVEPPPFVSPAPIAGSLVPEAHLAAGSWLDAVVHAEAGKGSKIALLARYQGVPIGFRPPHPFDGLSLLRHDGSKVIASLTRTGAFLDADAGGPIALCGINVDPGSYLLRHRLANGRRLVQAVLAAAGWQTTLSIRRSADDAGLEIGKPRFRRPGVLSVLLRPCGPSGAVRPVRLARPSIGRYDEDHLVETARQALADGTELLDGGMDELLLSKFRNPLAGILGGLLLDLERERAGSAFAPNRGRLFDEVVRNLRELVGRGQPDVEALSLRCEDPELRCREPIASPPMYRRSWRILLQDPAGRSDLLPLGLWDYVRTNIVMPPYFAWTENAATRRAQLQNLRAGVADLGARGRLVADAGTPPRGEAGVTSLPEDLAVALPRSAGSLGHAPYVAAPARIGSTRAQPIDHSDIAAAAGVPVEAVAALLAGAASKPRVSVPPASRRSRRPDGTGR